ncbi:alpha/beta hydrolase [Pseudanabaena sp. UWO311]|uniref:alpha/beta hydrolase n=1 Tax=Pseudanabaena sp. UWO311 TaxID=2487337 RepID=UPI0011599CCD|nr:alpha/beta hydrolase-fold protein [Pseudanabaena sp. UWO311]TYQ25179.1 alpha/beta hydrolase [Pseudanabaena sp. UWO311]
MANEFNLGGQRVYYHDEGDESGYFHTYDALQLERGDQPRKVHIFLPRSYGNHNRYPVVYMNDGNTTFWAGGLSPYSWEVPIVISNLYQQQEIQPVIIVAVHPLNRSYEYLHVEEFTTPFKKEGGGLPEYSNYMARLKSFIDTNYKTISDRKSTTILGSSHGGLAAFYTGCLNCHLFGNIAALSPSFWAGGVFNLPSSPLMQTVDKYLHQDNQFRPNLWIDWGCKRSEGFHNFVIEQQAARWGRRMSELLERQYGYELGKDLFKYEDKKGGHDERAWSYRLGLVLKQFYKTM